MCKSRFGTERSGLGNDKMANNQIQNKEMVLNLLYVLRGQLWIKFDILYFVW